MVSVAYDDGITLTKNYAYDMASGWNGVSLGASKGQLTYASTSPTWTGTQYGYDSLGRIVQSVQCLPNRCGNATFNVNQLYSYDLSGNRTKDTYFLGANSGTQVDTNYTVDVAGETTSISDTLTGTANFSGAILSNVQNGPTGPLSYQYGNGTVGTSTYDTSGRLSGKSAGCTNLPQFGCPQYFQNVYSMTSTIKGSQVMQLSDSALVRNLTMSYDEFGRLTSAVQAPSISYTYGYDRWGNRWSQNISLYEGQSVQLTFNTANNQVAGSSYDAAGNLISDGHQSYTYDAEGNLLSLNGGASSVAIYDALNHRVQLSASQYAFNPAGQRISKWQAGSSSPSLVEAVTYWNGQPVSYFDGTGTSFTHYDALGTKRIETNYYNVYGYFGNNVSSYTSIPFGDGFGGGYGNGGTYGDEMHFAQLDRDDSSNTEHAQFRQYDSAQGRWMSPDPYDGSYDSTNPQSLNRYTYAMNNPLRMVDPFGLDPWCGNDGEVSEGCDGLLTIQGPGLIGLILTTHDYAPDCGVDCGNDNMMPESSTPQRIAIFGGGGGGGGAAPNNRNCTPASRGTVAATTQYLLSSATTNLMTLGFFTGLGPSNFTYDPQSATSQTMAKSPAVQDVLGEYYMSGKTSNTFLFGSRGYQTNGLNPVSQYVGSFTWSITPVNGGINLSLTNYTSVHSLTNGYFSSHPRSSFSPLGTTHQTYNMFIPCKTT